MLLESACRAPSVTLPLHCLNVCQQWVGRWNWCERFVLVVHSQDRDSLTYLEPGVS